ncbi:MAG: serine hydrolase domain-containing protein [Fuerstiella sp.]
MLRTLALFAVFAATIFDAAKANADDQLVVQPAAAGMSARKLARVDRIMQRLVKDGQLPGAVVLVSRHGQIAHLESYGYRNIENKVPMTDNTIFRIYSMTKSLTSAVVLMLVEDGKLNLDAPVSQFIPEFADVKVHTNNGGRTPKRPPTVRDLLRHTSGLTYGLFGDSAVDREYRDAQVLSPDDDLPAFSVKVGRLPLEFDPGTQWKYSVASDVLGRIIEVVADASFEEVLQDRLLTPLKMVDTGFHVPDEKSDRFATVYSADESDELKAVDLPETSSFRKAPKFLSGGGGLVSTIHDYFRFLLMISHGGSYEGGRLLSRESIRLMTTNQLSQDVKWIRFGDDIRHGVGFGLGFSVRQEMSKWDPDGRIGEYGWGGAASTHYWISPKDDLIVITMEQVKPYSFLTERAIKKAVYDAIE